MDSASVGNETEAILQDRYPDIAFSLNFMPYEPYVLKKSADQSWNAVKNNEKLHSENIEKEIAQFFKKRSNLDDIEIFYLYGLGLGYHFAAFKSWLEAKRDRVLIILEEDLGVISAFLETDNAQDLLVHPQVQLRFISSAKEMIFTMKECIAEFPSDRVEIGAIASYE